MDSTSLKLFLKLFAFEKQLKLENAKFTLHNKNGKTNNIGVRSKKIKEINKCIKTISKIK